MTTTLTGKNQVTVPAEIAQKLGLTSGAQLDWAIGRKPRQIVITVKPSRKELLRRAQEIGRKYRKAGQDPVGDLIRERAQDDLDEGMPK
jgi:bifunctional DNA-binding transcriptional regulator/antitoxin component of YhaV-PrlF toxin-antitoxin module